MQRGTLRERRRQIRRIARAESFSSRDPVLIGGIGLALIAILMLGAFNVSSLPVIGGGTEYTAQFSDAGGLNSGDDVRIAGLKVGQVTSIALDGAHVDVKFVVKQALVGDQSTASINVKTVLGAMYLAIDSTGDHRLASNVPIPLGRTTAPYDVTTALTALSSTVGAVDSQKLAQSFDVLAAAMAGTPSTISPLLTGLSSISRSIADNDQQLRSLLRSTTNVTGVLAAQEGNVAAIFTNGSALLDTLNDQRSAINQLLTGTSDLGVQISGLVRDNEAVLAPALTQLQKVISILQANKSSIDAALVNLAPFFKDITDATGNGPWVEGYVWNATRQGLLHLYLGTQPGA